MSKRPEELTGFAGLIVHAVSLCEVAGKPRILRNLYLAERMKEGLGMDKHGTGPDAVRSWCEGRTIPDAEEFFFLKRAINHRLVEIGKEPYFEDEPFPRVAPWGDGDGASNESVSSQESHTAKGGYHAPETELKSVVGL